MCAKSKARLIFVSLGCLSILSSLPDAWAGSASITESPNKGVVTGPMQSEDFITGGQWDLIVTDGFYSMAAWPKPRSPLYSFNETDLQLGYMLPVWGHSFYRGNFAGLADLFLWESTRTHAGRSEEHTSELQSPDHLICPLLLAQSKLHGTQSHPWA